MKLIYHLPFVAILAIVCTMQNAWSQQILPPSCPGTASWVGLGEGTPSPSPYAAIVKDELYVTYEHRSHAFNDPDSIVQIAAWNGTYWHQVTRISVSNKAGRAITGMIAFRDELYLYGLMENFNHTGRNPSLVRWDGTRWHTTENILPAGMRIWCAAVLGDRLYCMARTDRGTESYLYSWDGTAWSQHSLDSLVDVRQLESDGQYLYALGSISGDVNNYVATLVRRWDGSRWESLGEPHTPGIRSISVTGGQVYAAFDAFERLVRWDGTSWQTIPIPYGHYRYGLRAFHHKGALYLHLTAVDTLGRPGSKVFAPSMLRFDGTTWEPVASLGYYVNVLIEYREDLIVLGLFKEACGNRLRNTARLCTGDTCATLTGTVRWDSDGVCETPDAHMMLKERIIEILPGPQYAITEGSGTYRALVSQGIHRPRLVLHPGWTRECPTNDESYTVTVTKPGELYEGLDFAEFPSGREHDLRAGITCGLVRPGRTSSLLLSVENAGTSPEDYATLWLTLDSGFMFEHATKQPMKVSGNLIGWHMDSLAPGERMTIQVFASASSRLVAGNEVCAWLLASTQYDEGTPIDNQAQACARVRTSFEPNEIAVSPAGSAPEGLLENADTMLTYTIRFQNTGRFRNVGDDTVLTVAVYDTLAPELNPATLRFGAATHPYTVTFGPGNALIWRFENIRLPDSSTNQAGSHGYFSYSIKSRRGIPPGTQIRNRASIYFDDNTPMLTNTVTVTTPFPSAVEPGLRDETLTIAPNPARDQLRLHGPVAAGSRLAIRNMLGQHVRSVTATEIEERFIDIADLHPGAYLLAVEQGGYVTTLRFVVVR